MKDTTVFFFDMGNTVLDFHASNLSDLEKERLGLIKALKFLKKEYGFLDDEKIKTELFSPWFNYIDTTRKENLQEIRIDELLFEYLVKNNIMLSHNEIIEILKLHYSEYANNVIINEGFVETAKYLKAKNKKLGIISNIPYPESIFIDIFKNLQIFDLFDSYMFSFSNVYLKPHKSMYIRSLMYYGVRPDQAMMIGDNYKADIIGAKNIGMKTCLYDNKNNADKKDADYYINNFTEIIKLYEKSYF